MYVTTPNLWGGRQPSRNHVTTRCWDDEDSDYAMTDWVDFKVEEWFKVATCEVFDHGYDTCLDNAKWRACELLEWKYEGNLSLECEPGQHLCVKFGDEEYEGLPPEMYSMNEDKHILQNGFGDELKLRKLKYM